jgi:hypothetical protein
MYDDDTSPQTDQDDSCLNLFRGCGGCLLDVALLIGIPFLIRDIPAYVVLALCVLALCLFAVWAINAERRSMHGKGPLALLRTRRSLVSLALAGVLWAGIVALVSNYAPAPEHDAWLLGGAVLVTLVAATVTIRDMVRRRRESSE